MVAVVSVMFDTPIFVIARLMVGVGVTVGVGAAVWLAVGVGVSVGVGAAVWLAVGVGVAGSGVGVGASVAVGLGLGVAGSGVGVGAGVGSTAVTLNSALACPEPDTAASTPLPPAAALGISFAPVVCAPGAAFGTMKVARKAP
jgi:hypothetical protein